jgi:L-lysine 6-transaminase
VARFPKFDWPRIDAPYIRPGADMAAAEAESLRQARAAFDSHPHDIACFVAEPIQGEGGDRHFRPEYFAAMRELCDEYDALLIFDEVQTGCGLTGTAWAYQQLGVQPDVVAFGKKTQVCGIMAGRRVDEVADNVFAVSSRVNSTWGGNLADMVRARRVLEVIEADRLFDQAAKQGAYLRSCLDELAGEFPGVVLDPRGRGLMCAFSLPTAADRDELIRLLWRSAVIVLPAGRDGIRFRPALTVSRSEIDAAIGAIRAAVRALTNDEPHAEAVYPGLLRGM